MTSKRIMIRHILSNVVAFLIFFNILAFTLYLIRKDMAIVYVSLFLAIPFFFLMFIRYKIKNIFIFLLFHFMLIAIPVIFVYDLLIKIALVAFFVVVVIYSISVKLNGVWRIDMALTVIAVAVHAALVFASDYFGLQPPVLLFVLCALLTILCSLLYSHIDRLDYALEILTANSNHPVHTILFFNNVMITIFLVITMVVGFISSFLPMGKLMGMVGNLLLMILRFLLQFMPESNEEPIPEQVAEIPADMSGIFGDPPAEPSQLLIILEKIFYYFLSAAVIALIVAFICYGIYRFYEKFYRAKQTGLDIKESIMPDITVTALKELLNDLKSLFPLFRNAYIHPYRKTYIRKINEHIKKGTLINPSDTTSLIANKIRPNENIDQLTTMYENIRYGDVKKP